MCKALWHIANFRGSAPCVDQQVETCAKYARFGDLNPMLMMEAPAVCVSVPGIKKLI